MRVFNLADLHGDMSLHFSRSYLTLDGDRVSDTRSAAERAFGSWLEKAWVKHFLKTQEGFLYPVQVRRLPSMFKSDSSKSPNKLVTETPNGKLELDAMQEWDIKDADAGLLAYYAPLKHSLGKYKNEIEDVRDYILSLYDQEPNTDLSRRAYPDTKRASDAWHLEQQRLLQARIAAEAALRNTIASVTSEEAWSHLKEGSDWERALNEPFDHVDGNKYTILRLKSSSALDFESSLMHHCVHTYAKRLRQQEDLCIILSIRKLDSIHLPLITVEIAASTKNTYQPNYVQVRGKYNHDPEQTLVGINEKLKRLLLEYTPETFKPLSPDLSFIIQRAPG